MAALQRAIAGYMGLAVLHAHGVGRANLHTQPATNAFFRIDDRGNVSVKHYYL
jgi:hypothetical protein